ncbi:MAG: hypothetical protein FD130_1672 [Halothiobacillaceae bacterium]|nr:MAG: hypothetical protein FD130_1672 [Halothiobacillaceae bacterium]
MKSLYVLTLMTFFIAGCAHGPIAERPVTDSKSGVTTTPSPSTAATDTTPAAADESGLPKVALTGDLLNDLLLADIAARRGHLGISVKLYEEMAQYSRDPRLAEQATRVAIYANLTESALASAQLWLALEPGNAEAKQVVTALMVRSGQPDLALAQMEKVLASEGGGSNGFMAVAGLLSREKDKKLALDLMQRFVAKHKESADAMLALSHLAMRLEELELAGKSVDEALRLRPHWAPAALQHTRVLVEQGKTPQALSYLKSRVDAHPEMADYRLFYARLLADGERLPEAYEQFQVLDKLQPGNEDTMFALGFIALQLDHLDEAERYLTRPPLNGTPPLPRATTISMRRFGWR